MTGCRMSAPPPRALVLRIASLLRAQASTVLTTRLVAWYTLGVAYAPVRTGTSRILEGRIIGSLALRVCSCRIYLIITTAVYSTAVSCMEKYSSSSAGRVQTYTLQLCTALGAAQILTFDRNPNITTATRP